MTTVTSADAAPADLTTALDAERRVFEARKGLLTSAGLAGNNTPTVGLALSGGGIRSATFSLGILQALSRLELFPRIDYLSTVSGGSYIGSFFGSLFIDPAKRGAGARPRTIPNEALLKTPLDAPEGELAVRRLREFGRYLTPGGTSDLMLGVAIVVRNWAAVQFVLGLLPLVLFLAINLAGIAFGSVPLIFVFLISVFGGLAAALGVAYWFTRYDVVRVARWQRIGTNAVVYMPLGVAPILLWLGLPLTRFIAIILVLGLVVFLFHEWAYGKAISDENPVPKAAALEAEDRVRSHLSRNLATALLWTGTLCALFAIWTIGQQFVGAIREFSDRRELVLEAFENQGLWPAAGEIIYQYWPLLAPILPLVLTIWGHTTLRHSRGKSLLSGSGAQTVLGFSILSLWLVLWSAVPAFFQGDLAPFLQSACEGADALFALGVGEACRHSTLIAPAVPLLGAAIAILIFGLCYTFLNLSSLATLYSARLKRAYIGASNPSDSKAGYDQSRPGDQVPMSVYYPKDQSLGGPMHLINLTVAQTVSEGSNVVAYDRKGKAMHIGPGGIVYEGARPGEAIQSEFTANEQLPLATWVAISGAAASTAIGSMTSLGLSVLAMMTNVRLGYWWKVNSQTKARAKSVYHHLLGELRGRFASDERYGRWYLTDGGHFENSGAYALLQRKLPYIIVCDNGADPKYEMDDIVRLLVRARVDLSVDIEFLNTTEIEALIGARSPLMDIIGEYTDLCAVPQQIAGAKGPYAALARIRYDAMTEGILLVIKPRLCFAEPPEILGYHRRSGKIFPQQDTADQFFDEEQWEAYRRFGEHVGDTLFGVSAARGKWAPSSMKGP